MGKLIDLTGRRFGRLVVIKRGENSKDGKARWICQCDCGKQTLSIGTDLKRGKARSCGCISIEKLILLNRTHGETNTRLYDIWRDIKARTERPTSEHYGNYGNRGITMCQEWSEEFIKFRDWALKNGYSDKLTIDRVNNNEGYYPENCRWTTYKTQANNRRSNVIIELHGEKKTIKEWSEFFGINYGAVQGRLRSGWSIEDAFSIPVRKHR